MNTDKIAIGLLLTVHAIAACVAFYLIVRDFIRKHRRGLTSRALDAGLGCPSCSLGLCPDGNGGFIPCTICGNTVQPKTALRQ